MAQSASSEANSVEEPLAPLIFVRRPTVEFAGPNRPISRLLTDLEAEQRDLNEQEDRNAPSSILAHPPTPSVRSEDLPNDILPLEIYCCLQVSFDGTLLDDEMRIPWMQPRTYQELNDRAYRLAMGSMNEKGFALHELYIRHGFFRLKGTAHQTSYHHLDGDHELYELKDMAMHTICGFIHSHPYEQFDLEVHWHYSSLQSTPLPDIPYEETLREEIERKVMENFRDLPYICRKDLARITDVEIIKRIVEHDRSFIDWTQEGKDGFVNLVQQSAPRLHAVCVYTRLSMTFLKHLLDLNFTDLLRPSKDFHKSHKCSSRGCSANLRSFLEAQHKFFVYYFEEEDRNFHDLLDDTVMPIHLTNPHGEILGRGAVSEVRRVRIDPVHHELSTDRNCDFALKIFKDKTLISSAFNRELKALTYLSKAPHEHIVQHITSWVQDGIFYILYPIAKFNLRDFMKSTTKPVPDKTNVLWFLRQLRGLADALRHIHHTNIPGAEIVQDPSRLKTKEAQPRTSGWHHDIKAENILAFFNEAGQDPLLKIGDFGAGKFASLGAGDGSYFASQPRGTLTYNAPDYHRTGRVSRPHDMWAIGCVFLELLIWFFLDHTSKEDGYSVKEGWKSGDRLTDNTDRFWCQDGEHYFLRPEVQTQISKLESLFNREGKRAFQDVLRITTKLFEIKGDDRLNAVQLHNALDLVFKQAEINLNVDPRLYEREVHDPARRGSISAYDRPFPPQIDVPLMPAPGSRRLSRSQSRSDMSLYTGASIPDLQHKRHNSGDLSQLGSAHMANPAPSSSGPEATHTRGTNVSPGDSPDLHRAALDEGRNPRLGIYEPEDLSQVNSQLKKAFP